MNSSNMKNMIVLKNLPSNIVEEAIIVLKENKKIKRTEYVQKHVSEKPKEKDDKYILKEAELIISEYISNTTKKNKKRDEITARKYKKLCTLTSILGVICWIELILILV